MGKSKRRKLEKTRSKTRGKPVKPKTVSAKRSKRKPKAQHQPTIPFEFSNRILLVGEGDFSFARSLLEHHSCTTLYSTSYDTCSTALSKYPQAAANARILDEAEGSTVEYGVDATKLGRLGGGGGGKGVKRGDWDRIVFNFPHVGGLTKDVNRQVRANQELLVAFFKSGVPLLSATGQFVVTVFEGEPYELWNIRDLARHVSLKVDRSFRFQASAYPGYKHCRTLGNIERGGGWKGEDRPARTYILVASDGQQPQNPKKRQLDETDSEDN